MQIIVTGIHSPSLISPVSLLGRWQSLLLTHQFFVVWRLFYSLLIPLTVFGWYVPTHVKCGEARQSSLERGSSRAPRVLPLEALYLSKYFVQHDYRNVFDWSFAFYKGYQYIRRTNFKHIAYTNKIYIVSLKFLGLFCCQPYKK